MVCVDIKRSGEIKAEVRLHNTMTITVEQGQSGHCDEMMVLKGRKGNALHVAVQR